MFDFLEMFIKEILLENISSLKLSLSYFTLKSYEPPSFFKN